MKSKYIVLLTTLLLALSSSASIATAATHGTLFPATAVDTHGPRIASIDFSVITTDPSLAGSLVTGTIQAPEWTFTAGSYASLAASTNVATGKTEGYTFDGVVFNAIQPIIGNVLFRQAIQLLTVYTGATSISTTILTSGLAGTATADLMPCNLYAIPVNTATCKSDQASGGVTKDQIHPSYWNPNQLLDDQMAAEDLANIPGLYAQLSGVNITESTIAGWTGTALTTNLPSIQWYTSIHPSVPFNPNLQYRSDDPLRSGAAVLLTSFASDIGLAINAQGITDAEADATVYGNAIIPLVQNGGYCSPGATNETAANLGSNNCPSAQFNSNSTIQSEDPWDMYTYGWVASSNFEFQGGEWMNTQFLSDEINTGYVTSGACDIPENTVLYSPTYAGASNAALLSEECTVKNIPDIIFFYQNYLFGDYINGWTGYTNLPSCGANTVSCAYYSFLNAHPTGTVPVGGTINYAVHGAPAAGGLDPIYGTNWVWQADLWSELYDSPLASPPTALTTPGAWYPYMLTGLTEPKSTYGPMITGPSPYGDSAGGVQTTDFSSVTISGTTVSGMPGSVPNDAFCYQNVTSPCSVTIPNGEAITYTFMHNMTWSDGVPITAADYQYSLWALDIAGTPALAAAADYTPFAFADSGPFGLIASTVNATANSITMYMGDQAFWNIIAVNAIILPQNEFQYVNVTNAFAYHTSIDPTQKYSSEFSSNPSYFQGACATASTCPLSNLANLEVTSGPFYLSYYNYATNPNAGVFTANPNYYRTAWWDALVPNEVGTSGTVTFTSTPQFFSAEPSTYLPLDSSTAGFTAGTCTVTIQKYTGAIPSPTTNKYVGSPSGAAVSDSAAVTGCGTSSSISIPISVSGLHLTPGNYEVTFKMTYNYDAGGSGTWPGASVWYQYYGFAVTSSGGSSVTGTPTY